MWIIGSLSSEALEELRDYIDERIARAVAEATTPEWLDVAGLARYLGKSEKSIRHLAARGRLPVHHEGRRIYFRRSEVDRALSRSA